MIAVVIVVLLVVVVAAIAWARASAKRSENKSVETYEHALGVLGEVSKRTESHGFRILPHEETGRAHVSRRIDQSGGEVADEPESSLPAQGQLASRRLPPAGEPKLRFSRPAGPPAPDDVTDPEGGQQAPAAEVAWAPRAGGPDRVPPAHARAPGSQPHREVYKSGFDRRRQVMARRAATGVAAGAALIALVAGAIYLSGTGGGPRAGSSTTTTVGGGGGHTTTTTKGAKGGSTTTTTTTSSTTLKPSSTSPLTFTVPSRDYTMAFQVTGGPCWVGIEHTTAGPWLYAQTMGAGQSATFKATGSLVVTLGAPAHFNLDVNGLTAVLPRGVTQVYSFFLTPASA